MRLQVFLTNIFYDILFITADEEEKKVQFIAEEVQKKQQDCEEDLVKAEPALIAAQVGFEGSILAFCTDIKNKNGFFFILRQTNYDKGFLLYYLDLFVTLEVYFFSLLLT